LDWAWAGIASNSPFQLSGSAARSKTALDADFAKAPSFLMGLFTQA
jgi:hypothetical protein